MEIIKLTPIGLGFIALLALGIGFLMGGLLKSLSKPSAPSSPTEPLPPSDPPPQRNLDMEDVLKAQYDRRKRNLVVEVGGRSYQSGGEMDEKHRRRTEQALQALQKWLTVPAPPASVSQPGQPAASTATAPSLANPPDAEVKPVSTNLVHAATYMLNKPKAEPVVYKSIAAQINDVLQEQIAGTPLAEQGIRLAETLDQGVLVYVGEESFPGVDAVVYDDVRQALKAAAAEWERRAKKV